MKVIFIKRDDIEDVNKCTCDTPSGSEYRRCEYCRRNK
jgi:hypothetical protein